MFLEVGRGFLIGIITAKIHFTIMRQKIQRRKTLLHLGIEPTRDKDNRMVIWMNIIQTDNGITVQFFSCSKIITDSSHRNPILLHQGKSLMAAVSCTIKNYIVAIGLQPLKAFRHNIDAVSYFHIVLLPSAKPSHDQKSESYLSSEYSIHFILIQANRFIDNAVVRHPMNHILVLQGDRFILA